MMGVRGIGPAARARSVMRPMPAPRRRDESQEPIDASYTVVDDIPPTTSGKRQEPAGRPSAMIPARGDRAGAMLSPVAGSPDHRGDNRYHAALRAYMPAQDYLGIYVDVWV